ncbi:ArsA-related P-loop ATPase [Hyperthermus butylicus]|uniref:ArsA/GET3 Anion-transporting ATPase-like domain-containing protein n=1 Tax=Hyperthermus butylicus (strain DSM 5456 / JCM 9403 / PLM1-5) TaxID=415426 RepID=A2BKZ9_HYPBU|nr:ArsA-related P-loop ATPase [Hyperthermus butylicus]ABM80660.1 hypothetical protein Hbut_0807 [Hyperthermus butylicus DSM 5456]
MRIIDGLDVSAWSKPHIVIVTGKGGVGKTTVCIRLAYELSASGGKVLLASLDPAGHLLEYLGLRKPLEEAEVKPGLRAVNMVLMCLPAKSRRSMRYYYAVLFRGSRH